MATESGTPSADLAADGRAERGERGNRTGTPALEEELRRDPRSFGFFQAVRLLQRLRPARGKVGGFERPENEVVRFSVNPSLGFPAGEVQDLRWELEEDAAAMQVNFMGLVGNQGVLPEQYSVLASGERDRSERPFTDFLDMFQHRILSLFYAAWERGRFYVPFERDEPDRVSRRLFELLGLGSERLRGRMPVRAEAFLSYCGLLGMRQRGSVALRQILEDYFEVPMEVEEFVGGWYGLSEESRCRVDEDPPAHGLGLGEGSVVGDEVWDPQARVRIRAGPLSRERYEEFLPGGDAHRALHAITRFFSDGQIDFELQLVLRQDQIPGLVLGGAPEAEGAPEPEGAGSGDGDGAALESTPLGWCTWIRTRPFERDADETVLSL